jgi:hypothetical protein
MSDTDRETPSESNSPPSNAGGLLPFNPDTLIVAQIEDNASTIGAAETLTLQEAIAQAQLPYVQEMIALKVREQKVEVEAKEIANESARTAIKRAEAEIEAIRIKNREEESKVGNIESDANILKHTKYLFPTAGIVLLPVGLFSLSDNLAQGKNLSSSIVVLVLAAAFLIGIPLLTSLINTIGVAIASLVKPKE